MLKNAQRKGIGLEEVDTWILQQGYIAIDSACETFLTNATTGNYAQMKSDRGAKAGSLPVKYPGQTFIA